MKIKIIADDPELIYCPEVVLRKHIPRVKDVEAGWEKGLFITWESLNIGACIYWTKKRTLVLEYFKLKEVGND